MISDLGLNLIKQYEGLRLAPYRDPVGIPTIGYGSTTGLDGNPIGLSTPPITQEQASQLLQRDTQKFSDGVIKLVQHQLTQGQLDALVSFTYNLGLGALQASTLLKKLNVWDIIGASNEFSRWVYAGGKALPGLIARREAERKLFLS